MTAAVVSEGMASARAILRNAAPPPRRPAPALEGIGLGISEQDDVVWITDRTGRHVVWAGTMERLLARPDLVGRLSPGQHAALRDHVGELCA